MNEKGRNKVLYRVLAAVSYGVLDGIGVRFFLTPAGLYSAGVTGISQLLETLSEGWFGFSVPIEVWLIAINIPLVILSWNKLGKHFTLYTIIALATAAVIYSFIPIIQITDNRLLAAIFGGILSGTGIGLCMRAGLSTGGTDIIVFLIQRSTGKTVGQISMIINGMIVAVSGLVFGLETALYSLISIYVSSRVLNSFYTQQNKVSVTVITQKNEEMLAAFRRESIHGFSVIDSVYGGYTGTKRSMMVSVVSQYELVAIRALIEKTDPAAFIYVQPISAVIGKFVVPDDL